MIIIFKFKEGYKNGNSKWKYILGTNEEKMKTLTSEKERMRCSVKRGDVFLTRTSETMDTLLPKLMSGEIRVPLE